LAITAIGSTAIGVTAKEVADGPVRGHGKPTLARPAPVAASHHSGGVRSGAIATSWSGMPRIVAGRAPLTHTSHHPAPWLPQVSGTSPSGTAGVQARAAVETPPAQSESTPGTAVSTVQPASAEPTAA